MLNQELRSQLSQNATMVLMQPNGEPEVNMKELQAIYEHIMEAACASPVSLRPR